MNIFFLDVCFVLLRGNLVGNIGFSILRFTVKETGGSFNQGISKEFKSYR